jgi:hypothetical protein
METAEHQQERGHEMIEEEEDRILVGDRVRLKGDHDGHWMTVKRVDRLERDPNNPNSPNGWFATCAYWTKQPPNAPVLAELAGFRLDALTKEAPPPPVRRAVRPVWSTKPAPKRRK